MKIGLLGLSTLLSGLLGASACRTAFKCEAGSQGCKCASDNACDDGFSCTDGVCISDSSDESGEVGETDSSTTATSLGESGDEGSTEAGDGDGDSEGMGDGDGDGGGDGDGDGGGDGDGDGGGDGDGDGDGDGPACTTGFVCQSPIPNGWSGPVVLGDSASQPCPAVWPSLADDLNSDPALGSIDCGCTCGPPQGVDCADTVGAEQPTNCSVLFQADTNLTLGTCNTRSSLGLSGSSRISTAGLGTNLAAASCTGIPSTNEVDPSFGGELRACGTSFDGCAGGGYCEPATTAEFDQVCIYVAGDVTCPAGRFSEKVIGFDSFDNSRECSACTCGAPAGECVADIILHTNSCATPVLSVPVGQTGDCISGAGSATFITVGDAETTEIECEPNAVTETGAVAPTGAITYCCEAP